MDVKHRCDRHVDIVTMKSSVAARPVARHNEGEGMQDELPVREIHAFRQACCAGCVKCRCPHVFIEVRKIIVGAGGFEHFLVAGNRHDADISFEAIANLIDDRHEVGVHEDDVVLRVVDRVQDLAGRQPDIDRVQNGANHGYGEKAFKIAMAVPVHDGDRVTGTNAEFRQGIGQSAETLAKCCIAVALLVCVDNLLVSCLCHRRMQEVPNQQRVVIGRGGRRRLLVCHWDFGSLPGFHLILHPMLGR